MLYILGSGNESKTDQGSNLRINSAFPSEKLAKNLLVWTNLI